jgi:hypothetical protein
MLGAFPTSLVALSAELKGAIAIGVLIACHVASRLL